jgi:hypothetical protein
VLYTREPKELWFCGCTVFPTEIFGAGIYSSTRLYGSRVLINAVDELIHQVSEKGVFSETPTVPALFSLEHEKDVTTARGSPCSCREISSLAA